MIDCNALSSFACGITKYLNPFNKPKLEGKLKAGKTPNGVRFWIYLPPDFDGELQNEQQQQQQQQQQHPLLLHLHGAAAPFSFVRQDVAFTAAQNELYCEKLPQQQQQQPSSSSSSSMIIVAPWDPCKFSYWTDGEYISMASNVLDDVLPFVEKEYQLSIDDRQRYIQGFSMGGQGAAVWPFKFRNKQHFSKVVLLEAALNTFETLSKLRFWTIQHQFANDKTRYDPWSPYTVTREAAANNQLQDVAILMYTGKIKRMVQKAEWFKAHLDDLLGGEGEEEAAASTVKFVRSPKLSHSAIPFLVTHGQDIMEFLLASSSSSENHK